MSQEIRVHCLVRDPTRVPMHGNNVVTIKGDLSQRHFGMSEEQFTALCEEGFEDVIHVGACVNHVCEFRDLRATNVESFRDIIGVCVGSSSVNSRRRRTTTTTAANKACRLHVVSTSAVYSSSHPESSGYATSKWVIDCLATHVGMIVPSLVQVVIYRPSLIGPDSVSGESNHSDWLTRLMDGVIRCGRVPMLPENEPHSLNMVSVDFCSNVIVNEIISMRDQSGNDQSGRDQNGNVKAIDITGVNIGMGELIRMIVEVVGVKEQPHEEWFKEFVEFVETTQHGVKPFIERFRNKEVMMGVPKSEAEKMEMEMMEEERRKKRSMMSGVIVSKRSSSMNKEYTKEQMRKFIKVLQQHIETQSHSQQSK